MFVEISKHYSPTVKFRAKFQADSKKSCRCNCACDEWISPQLIDQTGVMTIAQIFEITQTLVDNILVKSFLSFFIFHPSDHLVNSATTAIAHIVAIERTFGTCIFSAIVTFPFTLSSRNCWSTAISPFLHFRFSCFLFFSISLCNRISFCTLASRASSCLPFFLLLPSSNSPCFFRSRFRLFKLS